MRIKLDLKPNQRVFFTSDTHYNHPNICKSTSNWADISRCRDFASLELMNEALVENINAKVGVDDILIHLGDWSFGGFESIAEFRNQLKCKNIYLILGNHDHHIQNNKDNVQSLFRRVAQYAELEITEKISESRANRYSFILFHYPIASWNKLSRGTPHLHGHVHLEPEIKLGPGKMMDVGVDGNEYTPYELSEIDKIMKSRNIKSMMPNDHHE